MNVKIKFIAALALLAVVATSFCGCLEKNGNENERNRAQNVADYAENQNGTENEDFETSEKNENEENSNNSENSEKSENAEKYVLYKETWEESESELVYAYNSQGDCVYITKRFPKTEESQTIFTADYIYKTLENGNEAVFIKSRSDGEKPREQYKEYSSDGKIVLFRDKEPYMFEDCGGYCEYTYEYDSNGRLAAKNTFLIFESDESKNSQTSERFEYDGNGNLTKETKYDVNGNSAGFSAYEYDENGNKTRRTEYTHDGEEDSESYVTEWKYVYDGQNRIVSEKEINVIPDGADSYVVSNVEYKYDENNKSANEYIFKYDYKHGVVCEYKPLSECLAGEV